MSILTIGPEEINRRKTASDLKNNTDDLTFNNPNKPSSHGAAAKEVRDKIELLKIKTLERRSDIDDLLEYDLSPD